MARALIATNYHINVLSYVWYILSILCIRYFSFSSKLETHYIGGSPQPADIGEKNVCNLMDLTTSHVFENFEGERSPGCPSGCGPDKRYVHLILCTR